MIAELPDTTGRTWGIAGLPCSRSPSFPLRRCASECASRRPVLNRKPLRSAPFYAILGQSTSCWPRGMLTEIHVRWKTISSCRPSSRSESWTLPQNSAPASRVPYLWLARQSSALPSDLFDGIMMAWRAHCDNAAQTLGADRLDRPDREWCDYRSRAPSYVWASGL
jgi:hypothetical protein